MTSLQLRRPRSRPSWDRSLLELPTPHLLQTWEWGAFKSRHGWTASRYLWIDATSEEPRAAASVLTRRLGPLPVRVQYVPKGPVIDYSRRSLVDPILERLERIARREGALFIKIDPDVEQGTAAAETTVAVLQERGWQRSEEEIQFRNTVLLDLTPSLDDLLMGMKSKWRYNVRLAGRQGVDVRPAQRDELPLLYDMYEETARRGKFVIRPKAYYLDAWRSFMEQGLAQAFIAEVEGEPVAMVIIYRFGERAIYMYGASRDVHREKMPNNLLQWEAIQWAKAHGCTVYDMWGAPDELDESDPMWGVYRFKKGFGGRFVEHIGAWDYPVSDLGYSLYRLVIPRLLSAMRRLRWPTAAALPP